MTISSSFSLWGSMTKQTAAYIAVQIYMLQFVKSLKPAVFK